MEMNMSFALLWDLIFWIICICGMKQIDLRKKYRALSIGDHMLILIANLCQRIIFLLIQHLLLPVVQKLGVGFKSIVGFRSKFRRRTLRINIWGFMEFCHLLLFSLLRIRGCIKKISESIFIAFILIYFNNKL